MADNIIQFNFTDQLKIEGVNCKGYGILPKYVMLDTDLTIEAKTIYAYFCSFAGSGNCAFPSRDKILSDLSMSKDAYYKHFKMLTEQEYITVYQEKGQRSTFSRNVYTLVSNPKKFQEKPNDINHMSAYNRIRFSGLKANGVGMIPKVVMLDNRLPVKAKGIYAYFCSFTGAGNSAFPEKDKILYHLGITEKTYYKFYKLLTSLNYIVAVQRHIDGRLAVNDYYLVDAPDVTKAVKKSVFMLNSQDSKKQDTVKLNNKIQDSKKQDTLKQDSKKQDTLKQDTNINNTNINNININQSINQQDKSNQIDGLIDDDFKKIIFRELKENLKIPYSYNADYRKMETVIHILTEWNIFYPNGYKEKLKQNIYELFNEALIQMCCTDKVMRLKDQSVSYKQVIDKLNRYIELDTINCEDFITIGILKDAAISDFEKAIQLTEIQNPMQYMKSCIWNVMLVGNITLEAQIKRDLG